MKKTVLFFRLGAAACFAVILFSCKKSSTANNIVTPAAAFTFKVDGGAAITADSANALLYNLPGAGGREMDVYVYKAGAQILEFHFSPVTGNKAASTTLGGAGYAFLTYDSSPVNSWDGQSGALNLTTCDTTGNNIIGDFNFVGKEYPYTGSAVKTITEGHMVVTKLTRM